MTQINTPPGSSGNTQKCHQRVTSTWATDLGFPVALRRRCPSPENAGSRPPYRSRMSAGVMNAHDLKTILRLLNVHPQNQIAIDQRLTVRSRSGRLILDDSGRFYPSEIGQAIRPRAVCFALRGNRRVENTTLPSKDKAHVYRQSHQGSTQKLRSAQSSASRCTFLQTLEAAAEQRWPPAWPP